MVCIGTSVVAYHIGKREAGLGAGLVAGFLVGTSGLFAINALSTSLGLQAFAMLLLLLQIIRAPAVALTTKQARHDYRIGALFCILSFLPVTSTIPVVVSYHLLYGWKTVREGPSWSRALWTWFVTSLPFGLLFLAYYWFFFGLPYYWYLTGKVPGLIGQLSHSAGRYSGGFLSAQPFIENLQFMNGYFAPFLSWFVAGLGIGYMIRRHPQAAFLFAGYALVFSFFLQGHTGYHFLPLYTCLVPMAVAAAWQWLNRRAAVLASVATISVVAIWSVLIHVWRYPESGYPQALLDRSFSMAGYYTNLVVPGPEIAEAVMALSHGNGYVLNLVDAPIPYYLPGHEYEVSTEVLKGSPLDVTPQGCRSFSGPRDSKLLGILTRANQPPVCAALVAGTQTFSGTNIELVTLR